MYELNGNAIKYLAIALSLGVFSQSASGIQEGWYLGAGYGASRLDPDVPSGSFKVSESQSELSKVIAGYDMNQLGSIEFSVSDLGEAVLTNDDVVSYSAANFAGLYRLYDSQSQPYSNQTWGVNLFAKLGLGYLKIDSDAELESESRVNMLVGAGAEFSMFGGLSLRTELEFFDADALAASVTLLKRFSFGEQRPVTTAGSEALSPRQQRIPAEEGLNADRERATSVPEPQAQVPPTIIQSQDATQVLRGPAPVDGFEYDNDIDDDGVTDDIDQCLDSKAGYPVGANGCGKLNGVLSNIRFAKYSAELTESTKASLRGLAKLLNSYPDARVQLAAHTTDEGNEALQLALTRDRIRAIGIYLSQLGVSSERVKYLAFGARAPLNGRTTDRVDIRELR